MSKSLCVIGVDIGGTKTKAAAVPLGADGVPARVVASGQIATPHLAPAAFYDAIAGLIRQVQMQAQQVGATVLPYVAVAHPGRFLADGSLARGTTPNIGERPNQFDGLRPAGELQRRIGGQVVAENDAMAQMRYGLAALLRDPEARRLLLNEVVIYLGPGTGMGGGVARVSGQGGVTPVTDGHFFDVQVSGVGDGTLTAEELFTGPAIARCVAERNAALSTPIEPARAGGLDQLLRAGEGTPQQRAVAQEIADWQGDVLAAIIATIHAGRIVKVRLEPLPSGGVRRYVDEPDRMWSAEDQALVRGARRFLLGGFVGCSQGLGGRIRAAALPRLAQRGLSDIAILQIPSESADAGVLGVVQAIPREALVMGDSH